MRDYLQAFLQRKTWQQAGCPIFCVGILGDILISSGLYNILFCSFAANHE